MFKFFAARQEITGDDTGTFADGAVDTSRISISAKRDERRRSSEFSDYSGRRQPFDASLSLG